MSAVCVGPLDTMRACTVHRLGVIIMCEAGGNLLCRGLHTLGRSILNLGVCGRPQQLGVILHFCHKAPTHADHVECCSHTGICTTKPFLSRYMIMRA